MTVDKKKQKVESKQTNYKNPKLLKYSCADRFVFNEGIIYYLVVVRIGPLLNYETVSTTVILDFFKHVIVTNKELHWLRIIWSVGSFTLTLCISELFKF